MLGRTINSIPTRLAVQARWASSSSSPPIRRTYTPRRSTTPAATPSVTSPAPTPQAVKPTPVVPAQSIGSSTSATSSPSPSESLDPAPTSSPSPSTSSTTAVDSNAIPSNDTFTSYPSTLPSPSPTEIDWSTSFHGLSSTPFTTSQATILMRPLEAHEIEIKPDGLLYLPEILYRRILNRAFGPGGWGMVPRGEMTVLKGMVTREWGLVAGGRLVSVARGEQTFFDPSGMPTATEGCKSNALMRCCKDLGIASELWDPSFIRAFKAKHCTEAWTEHASTKRKQKRWRKNGNKFDYPYTESRG
ncbi:mitochondrial genome maintenance protein MGM101 [Sporobolomyces salmoneus]|uniref:mitochondrial genome maintenance protein MGM101 n=1 Tax=Sporobolomyces salmoneus TaxID=183962 RepID=UPI003178A278